MAGWFSSRINHSFSVDTIWYFWEVQMAIAEQSKHEIKKQKAKSNARQRK